MEDLLYLVSQAAKQNICWDRIEAALSSFAVPMSQTEQNPEFHGEGDVWTHTKRVCEELVNMNAFCALQEDRQQAVFLAALLHDIGKIKSTRLEDGKWVSPGHSSAGARMARCFLWQDGGLCGTPKKIQLRETVCTLIRYHSVPAHVIDDPDGKRKLMGIAANGSLCPMFSLELLCILARADALGRDCTDQQQMLEQIALCEELAKEAGCFHRPFPFPSDHTRYAYLSGRNVQPELALYDDTWGEVILMSGLPGTGKDTWIQENHPNLPMISLDEIRRKHNISPTDNQSKVLEIAQEEAKALLRKKQPFVWNATNITPSTRKNQIDLFAAYGAATRIVYLETDWAEQLRRNNNRESAVPEPAICDMLEKLSLPERMEASRVEWLCAGSRVSASAADYIRLTTKDYVRLEEKINQLHKDERIRRLRTALPDYIKRLLRKRALLRLEPAGITPALEKAFLEKDEAGTKKFFETLKKKADVLELSQNMLLEVKRNARVDRKCALDALKDMLLDREIIRFRKEASIAAKDWIPVLNSSVLPGEILLKKISSNLKLTEDQAEEFQWHALHRVFVVSDPLREEVLRLREQSGMSVTDFKTYACIGKDAWESFYQSKAGPGQMKKTSQETLLKLLIGFALMEGEAWDFMDIAGSAFVVRMDLVFLACICCGYQKPLWVMEILDFFAEDDEGNLLYKNPYD